MQQAFMLRRGSFFLHSRAYVAQWIELFSKEGILLNFRGRFQAITSKNQQMDRYLSLIKRRNKDTKTRVFFLK